MKMTPFTVDIHEDDIQELKRRLDRTRWPDELPGADWEYGIPLSFMKDMIACWKEEFDWRAVERRINSFSNCIATIDGMDIHFVYEKGSGSNSLPIVIPHGWPSTFYEMLDLIPYLAHPDRYGGDAALAFDVIVPSLPGHGFSGIPGKPGFEDRQAANLLVKLMRGLGYERFGAHGYDLGASVLGLLCLDHPERVIGYHTTSPGNPSPFLTKEAQLSKRRRPFSPVRSSGTGKREAMPISWGRSRRPPPMPCTIPRQDWPPSFWKNGITGQVRQAAICCGISARKIYWPMCRFTGSRRRSTPRTGTITKASIPGGRDRMRCALCRTEWH